MQEELRSDFQQARASFGGEENVPELTVPIDA